MLHNRYHAARVGATTIYHLTQVFCSIIGEFMEKYGQLNVAKIRKAYNDLRDAIRSGDFELAQNALDRYEQWADYVFDNRHKDNT
jgi:hypothetical protein